MHVERFAPSPTGPLHLGHAFSALTAWDRTVAAGGRFLLRIEDIDQGRSRPEWEAQIFEDLAWLGIRWEKPVLRQADRMPAYRAALANLWSKKLIYPCTCTRRDIDLAASAPQEGASAHGPDGVIYPGTCRDRPGGWQPGKPLPNGVALRLNMTLATTFLAGHGPDDRQHEPPRLSFEETGPARSGVVAFEPSALVRTAGDVVLARRDMGTSYHLSVVLDDAAQGVTHVTRGEDLFAATPIHVVLQRLLGLPTPVYHHHRLIRDETGKRLAKRDDARAISKFRTDGAMPADIRQMVGL